MSSETINDQSFQTPSEDGIYHLLSRVGLTLETAFQRGHVVTNDRLSPELANDPLSGLMTSAEQAGILLKEIEMDGIDDAVGFLEEGFPIIACQADGTLFLIALASGRRYEATMIIGQQVTQQGLKRQQLSKLLFTDPGTRLFVAKKELECDSLSSASEEEHDHHQDLSPLRRFMGLLNMERRDIGMIGLFAFVAGVLTLATPLAVESLVNVVSWGTYVQPLIILGLILLTCLGLAGVLRVLQTVVVEMIQRRQFVRIVGDLAHRFPRANQAALVGEYPRELANRVFDIMTIQKATAVLLVDGVSIVLTTVLGLVLLAFYHPFLLGFDIVLLISMISITWVLGRGGIRTAIEESITKYRVAHWLQDVLASPSAFKTGGGESLAIERANQLTAEYIQARRRQFRVVMRQVAFAISLQVVASTAVLALGGWLVIDGQLTLGQLVASELVVTVVVGAFAKAGKSLEKFYDLMAGVDKVGHLIDIPADPRHELGQLPDGPVELSWGDLVFDRRTSKSKIGGATVPAGSTVAIIGDDMDGRHDLAKSLAGLGKPSQGLIRVGQFDTTLAASGRGSRLVGYAGEKEIFHGTLSENIASGTPRHRPNRSP